MGLLGKEYPKTMVESEVAKQPEWWVLVTYGTQGSYDGQISIVTKLRLIAVVRGKYATGCKWESCIPN